MVQLSLLDDSDGFAAGAGFGSLYRYFDAEVGYLSP